MGGLAFISGVILVPFLSFAFIMVMIYIIEGIINKENIKTEKLVASVLFALIIWTITGMLATLLAHS